MAPRADVVGGAHRVPEGGSSATIASLPPRYGSRAAVQPAALAVRYGPPFMNGAVTCCPAAVVNGPGLVWLASNGVAHAARRYSASVSTQPMPVQRGGGSSRGICPRVAAAIAWSISAARSGLLSNGACATPAS